MIYDNAYEVIKELFESLLNRYQNELETSIRGSDFIMSNYVHLIYYKCHTINRNRGVSYRDAPNKIKI